MSVLVVQALYEGLIFGADRNISTEYANGSMDQNVKRPKVLKWPNEQTLFGYAGAAEVGGRPLHEWLESQANDLQSLGSLKEISNLLKERIETQRREDEGSEPAEPLIIHIGGFEEREGHRVPVVFYIANVYGLGRFGYLDFRKEFECSEQFSRHFGDIHPSEIRRVLKVLAKQFNPFWFHHGIDLFTFNVLESAIRSSFKLLCEQHPDHDIPNTIDDWAKHVRMQILMYGAYFEAFHPPTEQFVGGGADALWLPWPE